MTSPTNDTLWNEELVALLERDFGELYGGRTVLVTGADGFMGSHLTEGLGRAGRARACVRARNLERRG